MEIKKQPLISVIIPTFNREYCIERTIKSVINQTYPNLELIIIDNSTTGETREVLSRYLENPGIIYLYKENINSSEALNSGINTASGEYIALLDDDDEFLSNKLEIQLKEMNACNADFSLTNCIKVFDGKKKPPAIIPDSFIIGKQDILKGRFHLSHTHMMFKCSIKEDCKFDPSLPASDDFDLLLRIAGKYRILFIGQPLSYINKSVKLSRISTNPKMRIMTMERLIQKTGTYDLTDEEKRKLKNNLTMLLGFWQLMDKQYKQGRDTIRRKMVFLPLSKRKKYLFLYLLSYIPPVFETVKYFTELLWRISGGRIKA